MLSISLPAGNPIVYPVQNCCLPSIKDINAHIISEPDIDNLNMCANVSWIEAPGDCQTQPWTLAVLEWDDVPSYDFADDDSRIKSLDNMVNGSNGSWGVVCGLTKTKYYQFQLSTKLQPDNTSLKFGSHTYFFGKSSEFIAVHSVLCPMYVAMYCLWRTEGSKIHVMLHTLRVFAQAQLRLHKSPSTRRLWKVTHLK